MGTLSGSGKGEDRGSKLDVRQAQVLLPQLLKSLGFVQTDGGAALSRALASVAGRAERGLGLQHEGAEEEEQEEVEEEEEEEEEERDSQEEGLLGELF